MILTRCALRTVKPLWPTVFSNYSKVGQIVKLNCRCVATVTEHFAYGHVDVSKLDPFIGKWIEIKSLAQYQAKTPEEAQNDQENIGRHWLSFSKDGDLWTCRKGYTNSDIVDEIEFKFNEPKFEDIYGHFTRKGATMIERIATFGSKKGTRVEERTVANGLLTSKIIIKGKKIKFRTFKRGQE